MKQEIPTDSQPTQILDKSKTEGGLDGVSEFSEWQKNFDRILNELNDRWGHYLAEYRPDLLEN